jgi:hypothetical protein
VRKRGPLGRSDVDLKTLDRLEIGRRRLALIERLVFDLIAAALIPISLAMMLLGCLRVEGAFAAGVGLGIGLRSRVPT